MINLKLPYLIRVVKFISRNSAKSKGLINMGNLCVLRNLKSGTKLFMNLSN